MWSSLSASDPISSVMPKLALSTLVENFMSSLFFTSSLNSLIFWAALKPHVAGL